MPTLPGASQARVPSQLDGTVYTVGGTYFDVWELDRLWPDDFVETLHFPGADIAMSCNSGDDTCTGESSWLGLSGSPYKLGATLKYGVYASGYLGE